LPFRDELEIGWRLARRFWGYGYATEAAVAVLELAFGDLGIAEVVSITSILNVRSQRVMQRIGLKRNPGEDFDHPSFPPGHRLRPHVLYRAGADQWLAAR
jgi:ribosomal-protein-alanine N-acetyltransferase